MNRIICIFSCAFALFVFSGGSAQAMLISEVETNNSLAGAQNIDGFYSLGANGDIASSTTIPHVSIEAAGDAITAVVESRTYDYYSFTVSVAGSKGIFDIDYGDPISNITIALWDSTGAPMGTPLWEEDESGWGNCAIDPGGSVCYNPAGQQERLRDPFREYIFATPGTYFVGVAESAGLSNPVQGGWYYVNPFLGDIANPLETTDTYTLHVSLENVGDVPIPPALFLFSCGLVWLLGSTRNLRSKKSSGIGQ